MKRFKEFIIIQKISKKLMLSALFVNMLHLTTDSTIQACTFVSIANDNIVLVGYNEDGQDLRTKIWFIPATDKVYGRIIWGFDRTIYAYQGGMNDKGLFADINSVAYTGWKNDPEKPDLDQDTDMIDYILSNLASVDEVIEFFKKVDIDLGYTMWVFADAKGSSVIFEWANDQLQIIRKDQGYQICTNNLQSPVSIPNKYPCLRWEIADKILSVKNSPSADLMRRVLSATCMQSYYCTTAYSTICDLINKHIYLYNYHNFEEVVIIDLNKELSKGESSYLIPDLFSVKPYSSYVQKDIGMQWGDVQLKRTIDERGIREGIGTFQKMKDETRTYRKYIAQEWVLRNLAMYYLSADKMEEAIEVFKLNAKEYPDSWEVYRDLAEAYWKKGDIPSAVQYFNQALKRNPADKKTETILEELNKKNN